MRQPVVLTKTQVDSEVSRLCQAVRDERLHRVREARAANAAAGAKARRVAGSQEEEAGEEDDYAVRPFAKTALINHGTLYRLEHGKTQPTLFVFMRVALNLGMLVDLDDGSRRPVVDTDEWLRDPTYRLRSCRHQAEWGTEMRGFNAFLHRIRAALGSVLRYARQHQLEPALDAEDACRLLGMSHHTLDEVEYGPTWPALSSLVRVAGLSGYTVVLNQHDSLLRVPPWATPSPVPTARAQPKAQA